MKLWLFPLVAICACLEGRVEEIDRQDAYRLVEAFPAQDAFHQPLFFAHTPSDPDVYYVVTQPGGVFRIPRDGTRSERFQFLDLSQEVTTEDWEEGLLGFAFDPDYAENGYVYVDYSEAVSQEEGYGRAFDYRRQSVIARLSTRSTPQGPVADLDSELRILVVPQPFGNHNGGTIVFGPDQMLYIALGDGGKANDPFGNGQDRTTLLGSILRIDVSDASADLPYSIPPDNPFEGGDAAGPRGEIWAYGLRNPWRISFDAETGELWCGDVGQNLYEEVNRIQEGGNYGWNHREGWHVFGLRKAVDAAPDNLLPPVVEYPHSEGISVTGGYVYRGVLHPELTGQYLYGDFGTRRQWLVLENRENSKTARPQVTRICDAPGPIATYGEDEHGEILVLCYGGNNGDQGRIYRLVKAEP